MSPIFTQDCQPKLLCIQASSFNFLHTGLSPSMVPLSRGFLLKLKEVVAWREIYISLTLLPGIRIDLCRFQSTLLAASLLLSFPAGTRMIRFPAFPLLTEPSCDGLTHSGICGSKTTCVSPQLIAACCALLQLLSQVIRYMAYAYMCKILIPNLWWIIMYMFLGLYTLSVIPVVATGTTR